MISILATNFNPFLACFGGLVIGAAASLLLIFQGRIAGFSGILRGLLYSPIPYSQQLWRTLFLSGMLFGGVLLRIVSPTTVETPPPHHWYSLALAGLAVGLGASLGGGSISGHAICGLARLSRRSIAATATFVGVGALTVFIVRRVLG